MIPKVLPAKNGFDAIRDALFFNAQNFPALPLIAETRGYVPKNEASPADNTRVYRQDPVALENIRVRNLNGQRKAIYDKEEIYNTHYYIAPTGTQIASYRYNIYILYNI